MATKKKKIVDCGVLLIAHGGPESPDEIENFLLDIRGGRAASQEVMDHVKQRYEAIGGRSPLPEITRSQASALETRLRQAEADICQVAIGMRHGQPSIEDGVAQLASAGASGLIALNMSPFHTSLTGRPAQKRLQEAVRKQNQAMDISVIQGWQSHPGFLSSLVHATRLGLKAFGPISENARPLVIFTAHSLPVRVVEAGDPYDRQVRETAVFVAEELNLDRDDYTVAYQSAGRSPEPWLGPVLRNTVVKAANEDRKNILVVPIGFVADNLELLYDIDIEARQAAEAHGARLERCTPLNDSADFITVLADLVLNNPPGV